jgi:hypothetical protein
VKKSKVLAGIALGVVFLALLSLGLGIRANAQETEKIIYMSGDQDELIFTQTKEGFVSVSVIWGIEELPQHVYVWHGTRLEVEPPEGAKTLWVDPEEGWQLETSFEPLGSDWYSIPEPEVERVIYMSMSDHDIVLTKTTDLNYTLFVVWGIEGSPTEELNWQLDNTATLEPPEGAKTFWFQAPEGWEVATDFEPADDGLYWYKIPEPERFEVFLPLVATPPKVIRMSGDRDEEIRFEKTSSAEVDAYVLWGVSGTPREDLTWDGNVATLEPPEGATTLWFAAPAGWQLDTSFVEAGPDWWYIPSAP